MARRTTILIALMFTLVNVHGTIVGLAYLARSSEPSVPHALLDDMDRGDDSSDSPEESESDSDPPSFSQLDDEVKHAGVRVSLALASPAARGSKGPEHPLITSCFDPLTPERPPRA